MCLCVCTRCSLSLLPVAGPSKQTLGDIWHMAWQANSRRVVMVTNLVEDGRVSSDLDPVNCAGVACSSEYFRGLTTVCVCV